jgi:hypothetical protein
MSLFLKDRASQGMAPPLARESGEEMRGKASCSLTCLLLQITKKYSLKRAEKYMPLNTSHSFYESLYINGEAGRMKDACTKLTVRGRKTHIKSWNDMNECN